VTARTESALRLYENLLAWVPAAEGTASVDWFPPPTALPYQRVAADTQATRERLTVLARLSALRPADAPPLIVTSARGLAHWTMTPAEMRAHSWVLRPGQTLDLSQVLNQWVIAGYRALPVVEEPGVFARRGGIVDVWPPDSEQPVRIELFGDEVESLRAFDPATQRSIGPRPAVTITPPTEALPARGPEADRLLALLDLDPCDPETRQRLAEDRERLRQQRPFPGLETYLPYLHPQPTGLLDYLPADALVLLEDQSAVIHALARLDEQSTQRRDDMAARGLLPPNLHRPYLLWDDLAPRLQAHSVIDTGYALETDEPVTPGPWQPINAYSSQLRQVMDDCQSWMAQGQRVVVVTHQARRLSVLLHDRDVIATPVSQIDDPPAPGSLTLINGTLAGGWRLPLGSDTPSLPPGERETLVLLTDAELFGWAKPPRRIIKRRSVTEQRNFLAELQPGDYVVHIDHGIGRYGGLIKLDLEGADREYLLINYADADKLYVPMEQVDRISRYVGSTGLPPAVHRLGSADWQRVKERVRAAAREVARELLEVYAARELAPGYAFGPDTIWQGDLEASFPYMETDDQLAAIQAVKADMEQPRPMDRLICGDVGYGKTEVALRAAFKAMMDGRQVALLVPTTVLAQQHYATLQERLNPFPLRVEMLSRFRSPREQQNILDGLKQGAVDMVIGTHRLIQQDIEFKDLGLVIIDEEQRFGVMQKERFKQLRQEVDVLTLTATPIPRTLYLSLAGVRDMSTIDTPPEARLAVRTFVGERDPALIREAILREMERGGQVYYVYNRVRSIAWVAGQLRDLVPEAEIAVGHGQMDEESLERVMIEFAGGRYDVLICTTIIESGLDIPNVNTLIVDRADRFGLAQLYQLRGRVGRGRHQAYAYFFTTPGRAITETAQQRLQTILEASELGAGHRVAMRDLEIRGAGNILGTEQHGHIAAVGFDLYCRLLNQAVEELRAAGPEAQITEPRLIPEHMPAINLPVDAYIPPEYVTDDGVRLNLYQRLGDVTNIAQVDDLAVELADRFGPLPSALDNLLDILRLRALALQAGVESLVLEDNEFVLRFSGAVPVSRATLYRRYGSHLKFGSNQVRLPKKHAGANWLATLQGMLEALVETP
ncbi:MAG: transcription-repair coupling factor, partial [Chloroflexi bacterium]|nr:transcription-repair coupling factor [Chloroflexota bacterium]